MSPDIFHVTTVHKRSDTRIAVKQVRSLARAFPGRVALCVQDGLGNEWNVEGGFYVYDVGWKFGSRFLRFLIGGSAMFWSIACRRPKIVHFHDPELGAYSFFWRLLGIKTIYDVHEDLPNQVLAKPWIPPYLRSAVGRALALFERVVGQSVDYVVTATEVIAARFPGHKTTVVRNFPLLAEFESVGRGCPYGNRPLEIGYVGWITKERGVREMIAALSRVRSQDVQLLLGGSFSPPGELEYCRRIDGFEHVSVLGWLGREEVVDLLGRVRCGVVALHPTPSYVDSLPVKMFEYMASGLPVIASDFPGWIEIVKGARCGLLVDPMNPGGIAEAIDWVLENPIEAEEMGRNGRLAVVERYSWEAESKELLEVYSGLLGPFE